MWKPVLSATLFAAMLAALPACAVDRSAGTQPTKEVARDAALQPLSDINVTRPEIPERLVALRDNPYRFPPSEGCSDLVAEIADLDVMLGPDFDADSEDSLNKKRRDRAIGIAGKVGAGMLIPFRGVVREISGSASQERSYRAAMIAGIARRSYLRGIARERGCAAAPDD